MKKGDKKSLSRVEERDKTKETRGEREERKKKWKRGNQGDGISNNHQGREARHKRCSDGS